VLKIGGKLPLL